MDKIRHTIESLIAATGKSAKTIKEALKKGWFGPVELVKARKKQYYLMADDAVEFYMKKKYEKKVTVKTNRGDLFAFKYTIDDARKNASKRADEFMEDKERVRLEMLNKHNLTEKDVRDRVYEKFLKEESAKTVKVIEGKVPLLERRKMLALPLDFPTLILNKMNPNQAIYMLGKTYEYIETVGKDKWAEPWVRNTVINLVQEEIYQYYLHDLRRFNPGKPQSEIDEALTKSETRWIKLADSLGLSLRRTIKDDDSSPHVRDAGMGGGADNL